MDSDKLLLIKDICSRFTNNIICEISDGKSTITEELKIGGLREFLNGTLSIRPYLRPMSSMTDEEKDQVFYSIDVVTNENYGDSYSPAAWDAMNYFVEYCDSHYLDHRGLIWRGLALEAPKDMYKIK